MKKSFTLNALLVVIAIITILVPPLKADEKKGEELAEALLVKLEGFRNTAYVDVAGVKTIGYGSTNKTLVAKGKITKDEALTQLRSDIAACANCVDNAVSVKLNEHQRAALISFVYNVGGGAFRSSTLLKKINNGKLNEVPEEWRKWKYAKKKVVNGLVNRRNKELTVWHGGQP